VHKADVSFREKEARVTFDPGRIAVEQMIDAVNCLGFRASWKATR
jgi:copper chaperone CopZ